MSNRFRSQITDCSGDDDNDQDQPSGLFSLSSNLSAESQKSKGLHSLSSSKKAFTPTGTNTIILTKTDELYTYNDLSFDKSKVLVYAPIKVEQGWYVDRTELKTADQIDEILKQNTAKYEEERLDNPNARKPELDRHSIAQIDTEFNFNKYPLELQTIARLLTQENRDHHTTQVKFLPGLDGIAPNIIFATQTFANAFNPKLKAKGYQELPILSENDCDFFDYANLVTNSRWVVETTASDAYLNSLPRFYLSLAAHNAEAELNLIFHNQLLKRVKELQSGYSFNEGIEKRSKVVRCFSHNLVHGEVKIEDWVSLKAVLTIDDVRYHLCLRIIDTIKVHGVVSLKNFAEASGFNLNEKDLLSAKDKSNILATALERPEEFIAYSLGDTTNLEVLYAFNEELKKIYGELNLTNYTVPSLTIGRTVVDLDLAVLSEYLGFKGEKWKKEIREFVEREIEPFSPATTVRSSAHSSAILAKGFGGRIGQNQPTAVVVPRSFKKEINYRKDFGFELKAHPKAVFTCRKIKGKYDATIVVDIDISGCYAESQRVQILPIGRPIVGGLRLDTVSKNNYPTLKEFLTDCKVDYKGLCETPFKNYEEYRENWHMWGELDYGTFNLFIDVADLKESCDMLPSWLASSKSTDHKMLCKLLADAVKGEDKAIEKIKQGYTKKLLNEVALTPINFDLLELIFFHTSPTLRAELLEKARVVAFVIYPKSYRLTSDNPDIKTRMLECQEQLIIERENWKITNDLQLKFSDKYVLYGENYRDCHYWYGETIGDLVLNDILSKRKIAQWIRKKCPADLLYKLICNTHYGVSISPLFKISNICVGNNITARCRVLAWLMEKSFKGFPTITDGCSYSLNSILMPTSRIITNKCINMERHEVTKFFTVEPMPYSFKQEDRNFTYTFRTIEYVMKRKRIYAICEVVQMSKGTNEDYRFQSLIPLDRIVKWEDGKAKKDKIVDVLTTTAKEHLQKCFPLMSVAWMKTTNLKVKALKPEYDKLKSHEKTGDMVEVIESERTGMADFEIKNYYHSAGNHGMANYIFLDEVVKITGKDITKKEHEKMLEVFLKENKSLIGWRTVIVENSKEDDKYDGVWTAELDLEYPTFAFRGYESTKPHVAIIRCDDFLEVTQRYKDTNPAKDFLINLVKNPNAIPRQHTAIKLRSISIGDYKNNPIKFNDLGVKPGDQIKLCILFTEFSQSQFTFRNKVQFFQWNDEITQSKQKYGQSLEAWFVNKDGTLRMVDMCLWVADAIDRGVISPLKELSSYGKRCKPKIGSPSTKMTEANRYHPEWVVFQQIKKNLAYGNDDLVPTVSEIEPDSELTESGDLE